MHRLWGPIIEPLLLRLKPQVVVEIGCAAGENTRNLLEFCSQSGAAFHAVDPSPSFAVDEWARAYPDTLVFHQATGLEALPSISNIDVVLIDGDHNWYTVYNQLTTLLQRGTDGRYPVVLLHDVGWPYGRRDQYFEPDRVPEPYRQPYDLGGLRPGNTSLDPNAGFNDHLYHALADGGSRNGILTAVEDFMADHGTTLLSLVVPGVHGLGVIVPASLGSFNEEAGAFIDELRSSPVLLGVLDRVEALRVQAAVDLASKRRQIAEREEQIRTLKARFQEADAESDEHIRALEAQIDDAVATRRRLMTDAANLKAQTVNLRAQAKTLRTQIETLSRGTENLEEVKRQRDRTMASLTRLRSRRSVRFALWLASKARPVIAALRWLRHPSARKAKSRTGTPPPESGLSSHDTGSQTSRGVAMAVVDVVICVHNAPEAVKACMESVVSSTNLLRHRVVVVDDGSDPATRSLIAQFAALHPIRVIRNEEARGYTRAANQGIAATRAPFVILLNSDTVVAPGWVEKLLRCAASRPDVAVVGPYSNAASWQSIPEPLGPDGNWRTNELPAEMSAADMDAKVEAWSPRLYPEVPLLNGFCYMISRVALDRVGLLDEETFPRGYGEEDDYSIRCAQAGFRLYLADDCYVFHSKSQSFTKEGRDRTAAAMKEALHAKHGGDAIRAKVRNMQTAEDRIRSQTFVGMAVQAEASVTKPDRAPNRPPRVGWLQPHLSEAGGIRRAIEMTNRLAMWNWEPVLIGWDKKSATWLPVLADIADIDEARAMDLDILIVSDPDMVWPFLELKARLKVNYHLAPYMLYRNPDAALTAYYEPAVDIVHIANSQWMADTAHDQTQLPIEAIFPGGVDKRLFHPSRVVERADVVCSGSKRKHKGTDTIERACSGLELKKLESAQTDQYQLAQVINSGRVFASAAWHEGFNLSALEAMACGVPVVMTDDGGSREYATHEETALVVPPQDPVAMREQIDRLLSDRALRSHLIEHGIRTAWRFDWDTVTMAFSDFLLDRLEGST